jgi:L-malate glycosyltransferase
MSERIKILYLIDYFHRTGGTERHLAQLIGGLAPDEFQCALLAFDMGPNRLLDALRAQGVPVTHLPVGREYVPSALLQGWRLAKLIRAGRFDIVQTFHQKSDTYGAVIAKLAGTKHLISSKRDTGQLRKPWHVFANRRMSAMFDAFIAPAEGVRAAVIAKDHLAPSRIRTIYNGVDTSRFDVPSALQKSDARDRVGLRPEDFVVGMVAGFRPEKDHETFFQGVSLAIDSIPSLKVLLVGAGPRLEHFKERVLQTPSLASRTTFTGDVADVLPLLWAMDVGCLTPSGNEGFSNAVIEQMAAGLPMVVTDVGGNSEAVINKGNGLVIPPQNPSALCEALLHMYRGPEATAAMGRASRSFAQQRFSLQRMCTEHESLYRSVLDGRNVELGS